MQTATETTGAKATPRKAASKKEAPLPAVAEVKLVPVDLIDTPAQIRAEFDQESIEELSKDIEARGLLQPILLNPAGERFQLIAGERRLRAIKLLGASNIPSLLIKASADDALLIQLAENIQREDLTLEEECNAVVALHKIMGSLDKVADIVKKSKPWCSKRYAMAQKGLNWMARELLENGHTEDIELLKAISDIAVFASHQTAKGWSDKIIRGEAGRTEIRAALKAEKEKAKAKNAKASTVSQAKPRTPPPPPPWTVEDAIDELHDVLDYMEIDITTIIDTWTDEQRALVDGRLNEAAATGASESGFKHIASVIFNVPKDGLTRIDLLAMIEGYASRGNPDPAPTDWRALIRRAQIDAGR